MRPAQTGALLSNGPRCERIVNGGVTEGSKHSGAIEKWIVAKPGEVSVSCDGCRGLHDDALGEVRYPATLRETLTKHVVSNHAYAPRKEHFDGFKENIDRLLDRGHSLWFVGPSARREEEAGTEQIPV